MINFTRLFGLSITSGYLGKANLNAVAAILTDTLAASTVQTTRTTALKDEAFQEAIIAEANQRRIEAEVVGDYTGEMTADEMIIEAQTAELQDSAIIANAEAAIAATANTAAAALLAARLIDPANLEAVTELITTVWGKTDG